MDNQTSSSSDFCSDEDSKKFTQSIVHVDGDGLERKNLTDVDKQTSSSSDCCSDKDSK